jgi:hypothetical protein
VIIFGTRGKKTKVGEGEFYCPKCQTRRTYHHMKAKRYFTLYFIPLIPMGNLGEYIECQTCHTPFEISVLTLKAPPSPKPNLTQLLNEAERRLRSGTPVEFMMRDMTAAGLDREVAQKSITAYLSEGSHKCPHCDLTYHIAVKTCASCGRTLPV